MKFIMSVMVLVLGFASMAKADEYKGPKSHVWANFYYHSETREGNNVVTKERVSAKNMEFSAGYDFLINPESQVWAGGRIGIYQEEVLTSVPVSGKHSRPFIGFQAYKLIPFEKIFALKIGGAADIMYADFDFPLWLYTGALGGFRVNITENIYAEAPVEVGVAPFFDGTPILAKIGFQLGFGF